MRCGPPPSKLWYGLIPTKKKKMTTPHQSKDLILPRHSCLIPCIFHHTVDSVNADRPTTFSFVLPKKNPASQQREAVAWHMVFHGSPIINPKDRRFRICCFFFCLFNLALILPPNMMGNCVALRLCRFFAKTKS